MAARRVQSFFSAPGKVFLLGEYAVLAGAPAILAALGPRFELRAREAASSDLAESAGIAHPFAPASPAGRLIAVARERGVRGWELDWTDPLAGQGGFGASTAQFALTYLALAPAAGWSSDWTSAWRLYRELASGEPLAPSGADLAIQLQGGVGAFSASAFDPTLTTIRNLPAQPWLVFSATGIPGRKTATHDHLASLAAADFRDPLTPRLRSLSRIAELALDSIRRGQLAEFASALNVYGDALADLGLEHPSTSRERAAIRALPGVWAAKGAGAMQSDTMVVCVDPEWRDAAAEIIACAESFGLRLASSGLPFVAGAREDVGTESVSSATASSGSAQPGPVREASVHG